MLTNLGKKIFAAASQGILPYVSYTASTSVPAYLPFKDNTGSDFYTVPRFYNNIGFTPITEITGEGGVAFGSGTTAPTVNDYTIEHLLTDISATVTSAASRVDPVTGNYTNYVDFVISNNTESEITVSEICRFGNFRVSTTLGGNLTTTLKNGLIDRVVLANPVVIPSGSAGTIRYELVIG